jgi:hypothetical protein
VVTIHGRVWLGHVWAVWASNSLEKSWLVVTIHLEKYESQWEGLSHISLKLKNGPNHQPDMLMMVNDG